MSTPLILPLDTEHASLEAAGGEVLISEQVCAILTVHQASGLASRPDSNPRSNRVLGRFAVGSLLYMQRYRRRPQCLMRSHAQR
jgi:hypothetical protein